MAIRPDHVRLDFIALGYKEKHLNSMSMKQAAGYSADGLPFVGAGYAGTMICWIDVS